MPDTADRCPLEPEDKDGFEDADGCLDADNDGDALPDRDDKCPLEPEDRDTFQDEDGCPDPDNDGDGLLDAADKCPLKPETKNGYQDEDGCPDKKVVEVRCDRLELSGAIYFETDSDVIKSESFELLDEIGRVLQRVPEIKKVSIEGHTDAQGSARYNKQLSTRRVRSVRAYLEGRGVASGRLAVVGFGEAKPIAPNTTPEGRAKNRRVEFRIVEADKRPGCP